MLYAYGSGISKPLEQAFIDFPEGSGLTQEEKQRLIEKSEEVEF